MHLQFKREWLYLQTSQLVLSTSNGRLIIAKILSTLMRHFISISGMSVVIKPHFIEPHFIEPHLIEPHFIEPNFQRIIELEALHQAELRRWNEEKKQFERRIEDFEWKIGE